MFFERSGSLYIGRFRELFRHRQLVHGFSTRLGGVSDAPFDTLNLGHNTADDQNRVAENRSRFFRALQVSESNIVIPDQVHGDQILSVTKPGSYPETDGILTDMPGLVLTIQTADCVPIYLVDSARPAIGLVHAGWKGTAEGIAAKAIQAMKDEFGSRPENLDVFLGPSIGPCCYEVGRDVAARFGPVYVSGTKLDLWRCNFDLLLLSKVRRERIRIARICTKCHPEWFFSHRASGGETGRMMAAIAIRGK